MQSKNRLTAYKKKRDGSEFVKECVRVNGIVFNELADYLRHGREIEFAFNGRAYSITNHSGNWYLCDDTDHVLLKTLCSFEEKEILVSEIGAHIIDGLTIGRIFDRQLYDKDSLRIL